MQEDHHETEIMYRTRNFWRIKDLSSDRVHRLYKLLLGTSQYADPNDKGVPHCRAREVLREFIQARSVSCRLQFMWMHFVAD